MPHLLTLTGPSQSGKSTAIQEFLSLKHSKFHPTAIPKYTTRPKRDDDDTSEVISCTSLPEYLDLVYQQYTYRYGLSTSSILSELKLGNSPIVVLNDVRIITEVKRIFGDLAKSMFVYRKAPNRADFIKVAEKRESTDDIEVRLKKAEAIYRIYIENIYLFDHVLINTDGRDKLQQQVKAIAETTILNSSDCFQ